MASETAGWVSPSSRAAAAMAPASQTARKISNDLQIERQIVGFVAHRHSISKTYIYYNPPHP